MHLLLFLLLSSFHFSTSPQGFGSVEGGFKVGQPWEEEGERKNVRERKGVGQEIGEGVWVGGVGLGPLACLPFHILSFFFFFYRYYIFFGNLKQGVRTSV